MQINAQKRGGYETMTRFSTGGKVLSLYGAFHSTLSAGGDFFSSIYITGMNETGFW